MKPSQHHTNISLPLPRLPKAYTVQLFFCFFLFAFGACLSIMLFQNIASLALLQYATHAAAATNYTPEALNPKLTNTIGDNGGPTLYYNGSGPVPP